jgi:hypothetical protein
MVDTGILSRPGVTDIFANVHELRLLHEEIFQELRARKEGITDSRTNSAGNSERISPEFFEIIGQVFERFSPQFRIYEKYCGNQNNATRSLNKKLKSTPEFAKFVLVSLSSRVNNSILDRD